jgi:AraC-like DNA-binding protein/ligand-binding sensor protein
MASKRPLETILKPDVQKIFDHFSACFNIRILFCSPDGEMLNVGLNRPDSQYCRLLQNKLFGKSACLEMDQVKRDEAASLHSMVCYRCHAGLMEVIMPIYSDGKLLGFVAIGQFRSSDDIPPDIARKWAAEHDTGELLQAYAAVPCIPQEQTDHILGLFCVLVDYIISQRMVGLSGSQLLQEIVNYMRSHIQEDISLAEVADAVGRSTSTVSHLFTQNFDTSFKQTLTQMRLERAEYLMSTDPNIRLKDIAAKVGYSDALYFSRIYCKYRGFPPSRFVKNAENSR